MFTEHSVAPHPAELRAHLNNESGKARHTCFIIALATVRPQMPQSLQPITSSAIYRDNPNTARN